MALLAAGLAACAQPRQPPRLEDTAAYRDAATLLARARFRDAAARYAQVRDSFATLHDTLNAWYGQLWWTESMNRAGVRDTAIEALASTYALAGRDRRRIGHTHTLASRVRERAGQLDSALALAGTATAVADSLGDLDLGWRAYDALGTALSLRGRYREALAADSTSLAYRRRLALPGRVIGQGLNEVGIGYRHLGRYDDAVRVYEESYRLAAAVHDTVGMAVSRANLSNVRAATGDRDQAITLLLEAGEFVEAIRHQRFIVSMNSGLAEHYLLAGRYADAQRHGERALAVSRTIGQPYGEQLALLALGSVALAERRLPAARRLFGRALHLADSLGFGRERVTARVGLADVAGTASEGARAVTLADQAVQIADSLGDPTAQFDALEARGRALEASRSPGAATAYGAAITLLESLRGRLALGDLRMGVGEPRYGAYEGAIRVLLHEGRLADAFAVAERARARELLESMAERSGVGATPYMALRTRLREAWEARAALPPAQAAPYERVIAALADSLRALESANPRMGARPSTLADIQKLASSGHPIVAYFWGEREVFGWWVTRDTIRGARLGTADSLVHIVDFLRGAIETRADADALWQAGGRRAYRSLIAPLASGAVRALTVIPDGPLHQVPFETFVPDGDRQPLGVTREVAYAPSASVLVSLARRPAPRWSRDMLAVGNPAVARGVRAGATPADRDLAADDSAPYAPLPYAEAEARAIASQFPRRRRTVLVGSAATVEAWRDRDPGAHRYLHFALHAVASDRRPERNGLLFADQALELSDVRHMTLGAELVTLSACETGVGRWIRGEGIIGMQHAFLAAGAQGVVVSLWRVADQAAADFMQEFYAELRQGLAPASALRRVRTRWVAAGGDRAQPWRWAAFVYVGLPVVGLPVTDAQQ